MWKKYKVHLMDEMPRIGSGQRIVEARVGRKWVHVRFGKKRARTTRNRWNELGALAI